MKFRLSQLEFVVNSLADIRLLVKAWRQFLELDATRPSQSMLVFVTVEDRVPGEEVKLNFQEKAEVLDKFIKILEKRGFKFTCDEFIPGLFTICKMVRLKVN